MILSEENIAAGTVKNTVNGYRGGTIFVVFFAIFHNNGFRNKYRNKPVKTCALFRGLI